ncbi:MAG: hypothetical protein IJW16_00665 [Clostridia bacterium]|nr:hypothetical protein [Clostridia bacterium]
MATFTNRATLSYNGGSTDSNTVTGTFLETLSVTKNALVSEYGANSQITYVIGLVNSGSTTFNGLTVSDDLGAYPVGGTTQYPLTYVDGSLQYYANGVLQPAPTIASTQPLTVNGINVPAGGNAILVYTTAVSGAAPLDIDGSIVNTATVSGGGLPEALTASETVETADAPILSITKALFPTSVVENGNITYTFVIQNSGNTDAVATDNLVVSDTFDPILDITSVTLNGVVLTEGTDYTYDPATGEFATVASLITVPAATFTQAPDGSFVTDPGEAVLVVNGTL